MFRRISRCRVAAALVALCACAAQAGDAPSRDLLTPAKKIVADQLEKMGDGYDGFIDTQRHIVYISALDVRHRRETIQLISAYIDAQRRTLLQARPQWNITVVLPTVEDYRKLQTNPRIVGFYEPSAQRITSIDRSQVLIHEFTHALHHADMAARRQVHPPWVCEGLATLFAQADITPGGLKPRPGPRLAFLHRAVRDQKTLKLKDLASRSLKPFMADARLAYAQSRYLMLYLHEKGRLQTWYLRYCKSYTRDPSGVEALEAVLDRDIQQIQTEWEKWILSHEVPDRKNRYGQGRLGLKFRDTRQGVKIIEIENDSAAASADRLQEGDHVKKFNGQEVANAVHLASLIRAAGADRTVTMTVRRRGRTLKIHQALAAYPEK